MKILPMRLLGYALKNKNDSYAFYEKSLGSFLKVHHSITIRPVRCENLSNKEIIVVEQCSSIPRMHSYRLTSREYFFTPRQALDYLEGKTQSVPTPDEVNEYFGEKIFVYKGQPSNFYISLQKNGSHLIKSKSVPENLETYNRIMSSLIKRNIISPKTEGLVHIIDI